MGEYEFPLYRLAEERFGSGTPFDLAALEQADIDNHMASIDLRCGVRDFRRAARLARPTASSGDPIFLAPNGVDTRAVHRPIKRRRQELARPPQWPAAVRRQMRLPAGFVWMDPAARIKAFRESRQS